MLSSQTSPITPANMSSDAPEATQSKPSRRPRPVPAAAPQPTAPMLSRPAPGAPIAAFDPQVLAWMQYQQHLQAQAQSTGTWVSRPAIVGSSAAPPSSSHNAPSPTTTVSVPPDTSATPRSVAPSAPPARSPSPATPPDAAEVRRRASIAAGKRRAQRSRSRSVEVHESEASGSEYLPDVHELARDVLAKSRKRSAADVQDFDDAPAPSAKKAKTKPSSKPSTKSKGSAAPGDSVSKGKAGRKPGSRNYGKPELAHLVRLVKKRLPMGPQAWQEVGRDYNNWAGVNNHPERTLDALRAKFDALWQAKPPTGEGEMPLVIQQAKETQQAIEARAGLVALEDAGAADAGTNSDVAAAPLVLSDDDDDAPIPATGTNGKKVVKAAYHTTVGVPRSDSPPGRTKGRGKTNAATDTLAKLSTVYSPTRLRQREDQRHEHNVQLSALMDYQAQNRLLQARIDQLTDRLHEATRRADRAEASLDMMRLLHDRPRAYNDTPRHGGFDQYYDRRHVHPSERDWPMPPPRRRSPSPRPWYGRDRSPWEEDHIARPSHNDHDDPTRHLDDRSSMYEHRLSSQPGSPSPSYHNSLPPRQRPRAAWVRGHSQSRSPFIEASPLDTDAIPVRTDDDRQPVASGSGTRAGDHINLD